MEELEPYGVSPENIGEAGDAIANHAGDVDVLVGDVNGAHGPAQLGVGE